MEQIVINGDARTEFGKKGSKAERNAGLIPCVIYGGEKPIHFTTKHSDVKTLVFTPNFKLAQITVDGKGYKCFLKSVQYHPVKEHIVHIDFQELVAGHKVVVEVPIRCHGNSPGVKAGGKLIQSLRKARIKTTPESLVGELQLDISNLELGQAIRIRDIQVEKGVEIINAPGVPVALIEIPRALRGK